MYVSLKNHFSTNSLDDDIFGDIQKYRFNMQTFVFLELIQPKTIHILIIIIDTGYAEKHLFNLDFMQMVLLKNRYKLYNIVNYRGTKKRSVYF